MFLSWFYSSPKEIICVSGRGNSILYILVEKNQTLEVLGDIGER